MFEASILVAGLIYLACWMDGPKPTNRQALCWFVMGVGVFLVLNFLTLFVPTYVVIILCLTPSLVPALKRVPELVRRRHLLNSQTHFSGKLKSE